MWALDARVQARVDAGDNEVRRPRQHPAHGVERHVDAVRGGAVDGEDLRLHLADAQRPMEAEGVARRALLRLGRHEDHREGLPEAVAEGRDAAACVAVVVGEEHEGAVPGGAQRHGAGRYQTGRPHLESEVRAVVPRA